MKIKVLEKNTNKLLDRLEVKFEIDSDAETPKRLEVKEKLAAMINYESSLVVIKTINQLTGMKRSVGIAHAYKTQEVLKNVEPEHLIKRNTPPPPTKEE
ncbi:MAG TPA: 30S ribosomal protein S24e [candidate division Zixibacteria bacterium]|nr:30S ribosomal protein S24e [candidate division Zixibacteria bacterium]HUU88053.1 30S ribosomal protein S24e [Candidatus Glassbacteria bacterium]